MKVAGFDLDEVYEQEEARRKAEAEEAERQRKREELEARVQRKRKKAEPATVPPVPDPVPAPRSAVAVSYADLLWQPQAYREAGKTDKKLLSYDQSLVKVRSAGYERHPRPAEVMSLLCAGLEGKLTPEQKAVADDMLVSYGEWVGLSWERQKDKLIVSLDAKGLVWNVDKNLYVKTAQWKCTEQQEFNITGKASQKYIDLQEFEEALIQYHYGRSFADLPQEMREGDKRAQLYLPADGTTWPVGRGWFVFVGDYVGRAARGVAVGARKK